MNSGFAGVELAAAILSVVQVGLAVFAGRKERRTWFGGTCCDGVDRADCGFSLGAGWAELAERTGCGLGVLRGRWEAGDEGGGGDRAAAVAGTGDGAWD